MSVVVVGGMERLCRCYIEEARLLGVELRVFNGAEAGMAGRIGGADALVVLTSKVSHRARTEALKAARARGIPAVQLHACGVCALQDCLRCLKAKGPIAGHNKHTKGRKQ